MSQKRPFMVCISLETGLAVETWEGYAFRAYDRRKFVQVPAWEETREAAERYAEAEARQTVEALRDPTKCDVDDLD